MRIKIETGDCHKHMVFPITGINYELDGNNHPVDIAIYGTESVLQEICSYATVGANMKPLDDYYSKSTTMKALGATHKLMCAKLPMFEVMGALKCIYQ